jgi:hypothetical protein
MGGEGVAVVRTLLSPFAALLLQSVISLKVQSLDAQVSMDAPTATSIMLPTCVTW